MKNLKVLDRYFARSCKIIVDEADYLELFTERVQDIAHLVQRGSLLNERQCTDLYFKLDIAVKNIQELVSHNLEASTDPFRPALEHFHRISEKAKLLVVHCSDENWCNASLLQIQNEEAFREVLLEVGLCYNAIYEQAKAMSATRSFQIVDLCQTEAFLPASQNDVLDDQRRLQKKLEDLAKRPGSSNTLDQPLANYLLGRLRCVSQQCKGEEELAPLAMSGAILWEKEMEPKGTWEHLGFIGSGSGATGVCKTKWLGIPCARKEFHHEFDSVTSVVFQKEATILASLNHPNVVKFFCCSYDQEDRKCFLGMELMDTSLDKLIKNQERKEEEFPFHVALDIIAQIARGMCYLHDHRIAHRDLKPHNVVVNKLVAAPYYCVKLVDFGMSKTKVEVSKSNTISIPGVGTTIYRAPEVFPKAPPHEQGERKANWFKADVYSFAVTCAQILSLNEPYEGVSKVDLYEELMKERRPELPVNCSEKLVALLKDSWNSKPRLRPSFLQISTRIEEIRQDLWRVPSSTLQNGLQPIRNEMLRDTHIEMMLKQCSEFRTQFGLKCLRLSDQSTSSPSLNHERERPSFSNGHACSNSVGAESPYERKDGLSSVFPRMGRSSSRGKASSLRHDSKTSRFKSLIRTFIHLGYKSLTYSQKHNGRGSKWFQSRKEEEDKSLGMETTPTANPISSKSLVGDTLAESPPILKNVVNTIDHNSPDTKELVEGVLMQNRPKEWIITKSPRVPWRCWLKGKLLGSGSFGTVYEGVADNGMFFAVKEVPLSNQGTGAKQAILQFEQEIAVLSEIQHVNIVQYLGTERERDYLYIFLELVSQGSLTSLYKQYELFPDQIRSYTRQILCGLKYLHDRNIMHRDIKCANILVHNNGVVKLADFGMAKEVDKLHPLRSCKGSAYWMAPEVIDPRKTYDHAADIWSLGSTVLEMSTGEPPFGDLQWHRALWKVGHGVVPPIHKELPADLRDFISTCLQVNTADRPNCDMLLTHPFITGTPISGPVELVMPLEPSSIIEERCFPLGHSSIIDNTV